MKKGSGTTFDTCPVCGGLGMTVASSVIWDDKMHSFTVQTVCPACGRSGHAYIPMNIARESKCVCGGRLTLREHSFKQIRDFVEFVGTFVCEKCSPKKTTLQVFLDKIGSLWGQTKSIKIGADGVEYEKASSDDKKKSKKKKK
jgi:rRNA maturation protein Nop10